MPKKLQDLPIGTPSWWDEAVAHLSKDPLLGEIVRTYPGESLRSRGRPFETILRSIVGQQISVLAASAIWKRFEAHLGGKVTPATVRATTPEAIHACGLTRPKSSYVHGLALDAEELLAPDWATLSDDEVRSHLVAFRGVGPWTADMAMIFSLLRPDLLPLGDLGIVKGIQGLAPEAKTEEAMLAVAESWRPYRTAATWYLWRRLDPEPVEY